MQTAIVGGDVDAMRAREAFRDYRKLVREGRATEDDELLMRSYRAIAQGKRVLDLRETLKLAGLDEKGCPRLAIARADLPHIVFASSSRFSRWCYAHSSNAYEKSARSGKVIPVPRGVYPALDGRDRLSWPGRDYVSSISAAVPPIPAQFRPAGGLSGLHILWEAEWQPVAPRDPILLKRIGAFLFAVIAQWDLTELERAVLGARLS